jgi:hypothetical protein
VWAASTNAGARRCPSSDTRNVWSCGAVQTCISPLAVLGSSASLGRVGERRRFAGERAGEISPTDAAELADTVYTVYNGALVTWAIDGTGSLTRWLSKRLDRVLAYHQPA